MAHFLEEVLEPEPERVGGASGADVEAEQAATLLLPHVQRRLGEGTGGEASEGDAPPAKRQRQTTAQERLRALVEEAGGADQRVEETGILEVGVDREQVLPQIPGTCLMTASNATSKHHNNTTHRKQSK